LPISGSNASRKATAPLPFGAETVMAVQSDSKHSSEQLKSFYAAILTAYHNLGKKGRKELDEWERRYGSTLGTSAWPGWKDFIPEYLWIDIREESQAVRPKKQKVTIPPEIRWLVWERDNFTCNHCGTRQNLSVDHVVPESKGGTLELSNLQTLCRRCNSSKGAKEVANVR
jgi:5-methylcytosine-specific restriction protein A